MPKQKTKKSAAKRLKRTATGKIMAKRAGTGHLMSNKSSKRKRNLRGCGVLSDVEARRMRHLIP
ncbi:MAG: 50S ribosomal protein L35 [Verrucomicrobia bacterium]|nr:50S ribosomal protein L35 [Verrucomicrobiota bacterium]